jgi:NADH-quinone oxidoreductase subunit G
VQGRGDHSVIETFPDMPLDNDYSMNVADICPVGALTTKDFRFKIRVWFLEDVPGVCTGCSKGCNIHLGVANNKVYRYVPRRNDAVNDTWICDDGRMSYKRLGSADRLERPLVRGELGVPEASNFDVAVAAAAERLGRLRDTKGAGVIAGVASPHATNEDLFVFRRFLDALGAGASAVAVPTGRADDKLIQAEKAANAEGARALGFEDAAALCDRIRSGGVDGLIVMGHDLLGEGYLGGASALGNIDTVIGLDTHASDLQRTADVLFATRVAAEKYGTLTNHAGHVQQVQPAIEPMADARSEGEVLAAIGAALGLAGFDGSFDPHAVSKAMSESVPAFANASLATVGDGGAPLSKGGA